MCGILGWYSTNTIECTEKSFRQALYTMQHRGPDGTGVYSDIGVMLGHVRLAILDPKHGKQPLEDPGTGVVIVYNGELYNYIEERKILESKGHRFRTRCDTEVMLKLYIEYNQGMLQRLNGMFAFAIYDPRNKTVFCARDHAGIKPFYYLEQHGTFFFASEIKALVSLCGQLEPDPKALLDYIHLQYVMGEKTFFRGVKRLLPGMYLTVGTNVGVRHGKFWEIQPQCNFEGSVEDAAEQLHELLEDSVRIQLRSDAPLGAHLSGGLDTGSICALAARQIHPKRIQTFTAGFEEGGIFDDTATARASANHIGSDHHEIFPTGWDFANLYPKLLWHLDEPMAAQGVFPQYMVSRLASQHVKVVLGGQGADEIFGGYARYYILLLDQAIRNGAEQGDVNIGLSWDDLGRSLGQLHNYGPLWNMIQREGSAFEEPELRYWRMIDRSGQINHCLTDEFLASTEGYSPYEKYREYVCQFPKAELLNRILFFESSCWLPALLHVEDRMSMAVSLESRVPILDPRILAFAFSLPTRVKFGNGMTKAVMRKAFASELLPQIRDRRDKLGFPVPTSRWFSGILKDFVYDNLVSSESLTRGIFKPESLKSSVEPHGDYDRSIWGMLNLELWHRNLKPAPNDVIMENR